MSEKLCIFCKHFDWEPPGEIRHSEWTADMEGGASCLRHRYTDMRPDDAKDMRQIMLRAAHCPDYERPA